MTGYRRVRLDWLVTESRRVVDLANLGANEVLHYSIPNIDEHHGGLVERAEAISSGKLLLKGGEILISKLNPRISRVVVAVVHDEPAVASTEFIALIPRGVTDCRWLCYWLSSERTRQFLEGSSLSVTRSHQRVRPEVLTKQWLDLPASNVQRAIADFLDAETARIDALIEKKRRMSDVSEELDFAFLSELIVPAEAPFARLGFFASLQTGLTLDAGRPSSRDEVTRPYLRVANVQAGWLDLEEVADVTVPGALAARATLRAGDVLMTEGGDLDKLGRGTMWEGQLPGCLHQNHVFAVRPDVRWLDPEYLALLTRTSHARRYFESTGVQTTNLASTNSVKILGLPIPKIPIAEQRQIVGLCRAQLERTERLRRRLHRQIALLEERRRALITAAVTGQIDIPGAAA